MMTFQNDINMYYLSEYILHYLFGPRQFINHKRGSILLVCVCVYGCNMYVICNTR